MWGKTSKCNSNACIVNESALIWYSPSLGRGDSLLSTIVEVRMQGEDVIRLDDEGWLQQVKERTLTLPIPYTPTPPTHQYACSFCFEYTQFITHSTRFQDSSAYSGRPRMTLLDWMMKDDYWKLKDGPLPYPSRIFQLLLPSSTLLAFA